MSQPHLLAWVELIRSSTPQTFWAVWSLAALLGAFLLWLGVHDLHRARLLDDLPTSKVRSAAQGYVELEGWARMMPGEPIYAPLSGQPCAWYSYRIEHRARDSEGRDRGWRTLESDRSNAIFHLDDGTGCCIIDPEGADVTPAIRLRWRGYTARPGAAPRETGFWARLLSTGSYRYTECRIGEYDRLYAVGLFVGLGDREAVSLSDEVRDVLSVWKRDRAKLLRRFDRDGNGEVDLDEWEEARSVAQGEVLARSAARGSLPEFNVLKKPTDGRPFLLSCIPQERIVARTRRHAVLALSGFLSVGAALVWALQYRPT